MAAARWILLLASVIAWLLAACGTPASDQVTTTPARPADAADGPTSPGAVRPLPSPERRQGMALSEALDRRRSVRSFKSTPLADEELGQLLWAAQGLNDGDGRRTAPSAGATYPLVLVVATADGLFRYDVERHALGAMAPDDVRVAIADAAIAQTWIAAAPVIVVIAAVPGRTEARYGARAERSIALEAGHAAQNLLLQATALGLGAVPVGAFDDDRLARVIGLEPGEKPLYVVPVGRPAK